MKHSIVPICFAVLLAAGGCAKSEESADAAAYSSMSGGKARAENPTANLVGAGQNREAPPVAPKEVPQRSVIRNGSLSVRVPNVEKAEDEVVRLVQSAGGYVDSAESSDLASATPILTMKLRVPAPQFDRVMNGLEGLGMRLSKKVSSEDVTSSLVDMNARLKIMRAQEEVYRRLLAKSGSQSEMMDVQEKLMNLRGMIESLESQHKTLSRLAALSSIELTLQQSAEDAAMATSDPNWAKEAWGSATGAIGNVARIAGSFLIWAAVFSPFWIPVLWFARKSLYGKKVATTVPNFDVPA